MQCVGVHAPRGGHLGLSYLCTFTDSARSDCGNYLLAIFHFMCFAGPVFHHVCLAVNRFDIHLIIIVMIPWATSYIAAY
jgi:hypothetical protein